MKANLTTIALVISMTINVLQFLSQEAREWYVVTHNAKSVPQEVMTSNNKSLSVYSGKGTGIYRDEVITKAGQGN